MSDVPSSYLVVPEPSDRHVRTLQSRVRKIALRALLTAPTTDVGPDLRRGLNALRPVLTQMLTTKPAVLLDAIGNPDVICPLLVLAVGPSITGKTADELLRAAVPPLLVTLSHRARSVPEAILWDVPLDTLPDESGYRLFRFDPPARGLLLDPVGLELCLADDTKLRLPPAPAAPPDRPGLTVERPFRQLRKDCRRIQLSLWDSNPLSMFEAHPDKDGNAISLGDRTAKQWLEAYDEALELIRIALPTWFEEFQVSGRRLVPVGYLPERHLSASYREAPSTAYLTLCDNPLTMAEAIVHETQHTKVNLLSWVDPIVHNAHTCWTESPVRPDLRPLWGVLLAVHAFVPVAAMHHRLAELDHPCTHNDRFPRRRAEVLAGNDTGMKAVMAHADPSPLGAKLLGEMSTLHEFLMAAAPSTPEHVFSELILPPS